MQGVNRETAESIDAAYKLVYVLTRLLESATEIIHSKATSVTVFIDSHLPSYARYSDIRFHRYVSQPH